MLRERVAALALLAVVVLVSAVSAQAQTQTRSAHQQLTFEIYKELVEINTVTATGDTARAAEAMAARLRAAGFTAPDLQVFTPAPRKGNLVARLRGTGARKPILLLAHIDVVEAKAEDWSVDPFKLIESDGYYYGRGSGDDKYMAAVFVANLIRYRNEGYKPERDIIVALETDEEILDKDAVGIQWLLKNHRDLIDAEFALNEGAGVGLDKGKPLRVGVQTSEKVFMNYRLEVKDPGGHSSLPGRSNAIYRLAEGLARLGRFDFPMQLNDTTRMWLQRASAFEDAQTGADMRSAASARPDPAAVARLSEQPRFNAQLRTTCTATMLDGGHAMNALPQTANALVNCRVLPGEPLDEVQKTLVRVVADDRIEVKKAWEPTLSPPSPLTPELMGAIEKLSAEFWPGAPVIPTMVAGGTDGAHLRNAGIPTYGHSGMAGEVTENRIHGRDERVMVKSFYEGQEYLYRLVKMLAGGR
jgi:acetylornithine deacetylase/succinyl-diaminopimelate desuccinylase-like protein